MASVRHRSHNGDGHHTNHSASRVQRQQSKHEAAKGKSASHPSLTTLIPITGEKEIDINASSPTTPQPCSPSVQQVRTGVNTEGDLPHYVMIPIGKTGDGKSSLLNAMFGYKEFTANASYKSVTDAVLERTGVWTVKGKNTIVTVADTPGFADSAGRDFTAEIQDYIFDVSNRIGIDAFLLVCSFKTKIPVVENILKEFAALMKHMEPRDWRKHVILVFTKVDYKHRDLNETTDHKNFLVNQFSKQMKDMLGLEENLPVAFVSNQLPECGITKGRPCDCAPYKEYYFSKMYTLQAKIELCAKLGRWRAIRPPPPPPLPTKQPPPVPPPHAMHPTSHPPPPPHDPYYNAQAPPAHYNPLYVTQHR